MWWFGRAGLKPLVLGGEFGPEHLFRFERGPESDADGEPKSRSDPTLLGDGWRWVGGWYVVWDEYKTDESGWSYNFNWPEPGEDRTSVLFQGWSAEASDRFGAQTWVRRRRWERHAEHTAVPPVAAQRPGATLVHLELVALLAARARRAAIRARACFATLTPAAATLVGQRWWRRRRC